MHQRPGQKAAGHGFRMRLELLRGAGRDHATAAHAGAGTYGGDVIGASDGVHNVVHHHHTLASRGQLRQRIEQYLVVSGVQADRGLIEHIAHPLQIGSQLRREPYALRLPAREARRGAIERHIAQTDTLEKAQTSADLGERVAGNGRFAHRQAQAFEEGAQALYRQRRELGDRALLEAQMQRGSVEARAMATRTVLRAVGAVSRRLEPLRFLAGLLCCELCHLHTGAKAARTPALAGVEGQQPRIRLGKAAPTGRAGTAGAENLQLAARWQNVHDAFAEFERLLYRGAQRRLLSWPARHAGDGQLDVVFDETLEAWEWISLHPLSIHAQ